MFVNWPETFAKLPLAKQIVGKMTHYQKQERGLCIYFFKQYCVHLLVKKKFKLEQPNHIPTNITVPG